MSKYKNIKEFKSFGATLENECFPTVKLKPGTFVDKTTVKVMKVLLYHYWKKTSLPNPLPKSSKLRLKFKILAGISYNKIKLN